MKTILEKYEITGFQNQLVLKNLSENNFECLSSDNFDNVEQFVRDINDNTDFIAYTDLEKIMISKIDFAKKTSSKKTFLRLGFLPEDEKSYNYILKEREIGVSVFQFENDKPKLNTLQLISSFATRETCTSFVVTGDVVGEGFDGEPLIKNVEYVSVVDLDFRDITSEYLSSFYSKIEDNDYFSDFFYHVSGISYCDKIYNDPKHDFDDRLGFDRALDYYQTTIDNKYIKSVSDRFVTFYVPQGEYTDYTITISRHNLMFDKNFIFEVSSVSVVDLVKKNGKKVVDRLTFEWRDFVDGNVMNDVFTKVNFKERSRID